MSPNENLLLSRHALVMVFVALQPGVRAPESPQRSVLTLGPCTASSTTSRTPATSRGRQSWRNVYEVRRDAAVQDPDFIDSSVGELLSDVLR